MAEEKVKEKELMWWVQKRLHMVASGAGGMLINYDMPEDHYEKFEEMMIPFEVESIISNIKRKDVFVRITIERKYTLYAWLEDLERVLRQG